MNLDSFKSKLLRRLNVGWIIKNSSSEKERLEYIDKEILHLENKLEELQKEIIQLRYSKKDIDAENKKLKEALDRFENPN